MLSIFNDVPDALAMTLDIVDKVEFYGINSGPVMPVFPI